MLLFVTSLFAVMVPTCAQVKVKVDFYYEVGCPFCLKFMQEVLPALLTAPGMLETVVDFVGHPFGNAYFVTPACGGAGAYNMNARLCWEKSCGFQALGFQAPDCSNGELVCQHGDAECKLNRFAACAKAVTSDPRIYMPFSRCMGEGAGAAGASGTEATLAATCATSNGVPSIEQCYISNGVPNGAALIQQEASMVPVHTVVPYVTVNGVAIADHDQMFAEVCKAWTGAPVAPCAPYLAPARKLDESATIV